MARILLVFTIFLLAAPASAYFYPKQCLNQTIALETKLLKASVEFASLGYFMQGYRDLKLAWKLVPDWLLYCIPIIIIPDTAYEFENIDESELESHVWANIDMLQSRPLLKEIDFTGCYEVIKYSILKMEEIVGYGKEKQIENMLKAMKELGDIGREIENACEA